MNVYSLYKSMDKYFIQKKPKPFKLTQIHPIVWSRLNPLFKTIFNSITNEILNKQFSEEFFKKYLIEVYTISEKPKDIKHLYISKIKEFKLPNQNQIAEEFEFFNGIIDGLIAQQSFEKKLKYQKENKYKILLEEMNDVNYFYKMVVELQQISFTLAKGLYKLLQLNPTTEKNPKIQKLYRALEIY